MVRFPWVRLGLAVISLSLGVAGGSNGDPQPESTFDADSIVSLLELVIEADEDSARRCLSMLSAKSQTGEISDQQIKTLRLRLGKTLDVILASSEHALFADAAILAATWKEPAGIRAARAILLDTERPENLRLAAFESLIATADAQALSTAAKLLADTRANTTAFRGKLLSTLGRLEKPEVALIVLETYPQLEDELKPRAIELLTQRASWGKLLLTKIRDKRLPADVANVNQVKRLLATGDAEIERQVAEIWGAIRTERNDQREAVVREMRAFLEETAGDAHRGQAVFAKVCGQCHKIYAQGEDVGPDITGNGRASFEQLLSNVFDPSLVIGEAYQAHTVVTFDGRVLSGLPIEDNDQRIVLKMQGGKTETIAREDVEQLQISKLSLMPEGLERQLQPQEIADLFAFLTLNRPPSDPEARYIPGTPIPEK